MYENLPTTGPAVIVIGGVAVASWHLALLLLVAGFLLVAAVRVHAHRNP